MTAAASGSNPELTQEARQGLGKAALIVALLAVVLMVVFFFSLRQNIAALDSQVQGVTGAEETVQAMEEKVEGLDSQVAELDKEVESLNKAMDELEGLPEETKRVVYSSMMDEMAQKADMLGKELDDASQKKLAEVQKILKEIRSGM